MSEKKANKKGGRKLRSLYECYHARIKSGRICCDKGHRLPSSSFTPLERGAPLIYQVCQDCRDFSRMGKPLAAHDRGWNNAGNAI